jgi:hypothetical protein
MGATPSPDSSSTSEIRADLKPLMPWWQWIAGLMLFTGGFAVFPQTFDLPSVAFFILVLAGVATAMVYFLRKKSIPVTIKLGEECVLLQDQTRPDLGKLVPSRVVQEDDHRVLVYRGSKRRELKRMEFIFANAEDTSKAMLMFKRFLPRQSRDSLSNDRLHETT